MTETEDTKSEILVQTDAVSKYFRTHGGLFSGAPRLLRAVENVSIHVKRGETMALVGESGSGKSTLGRLILRLIEPSSGRIHYDGQPITDASSRQMRPLRIHKLVKDAQQEQSMLDSLLERVGLRSSVLDRYPHEFSGGQRQRIGIARALAVGPEFIVCDEPVSALDVSIQAQIINLLLQLQDQLGLAYLFISHDLRVVRHMSHRVAVMYLGQIVEQALVADLYDHPRHPYTRALLDSAPTLEPGAPRKQLKVHGELPSPFDPPPGCSFHPRCDRMQKGKCDVDTPTLDRIDTKHKVACFFPLD